MRVSKDCDWNYYHPVLDWILKMGEEGIVVLKNLGEYSSGKI